MTETMPARIVELWGGWEPDEREWLKDFRDALQTRYADAITRAVLFGSRARGDWNEDSDIDVLVIVRNQASSMKKEIQELGASLSVGRLAVPTVPTVILQTEAEWTIIGGSGAAPAHRGGSAGGERPMKGDTALAHWSNAVEGLESAEILHNHGKYKRAISEAYYTMEAAARASLATKEVHPKTRTRRMESADQQDGPQRRDGRRDSGSPRQGASEAGGSGVRYRSPKEQKQKRARDARARAASLRRRGGTC